MAEIHYKLGMALGLREDWQQAAIELRKAITLEKDWLEPQRELGRVLVKLEAWDESVSVLREVVAHSPEDSQTWHLLGDALSKLEQWSEAAQAYENAIALNPEFFWSHNNLGDVLLQLQRWDEAARAYENAIALNPEFFWSHNNLGDALLQLERWDEATQAYENAISLKSDFPWSHYNLGEALSKLQRWDEAIKAYKNAIEIKSDLPCIYEKLGDALRHQVPPNLQEISQAYEQAIQANPQDLQIYYRALEANPKDAKISLMLADAFRSQGQLDQAVTFYKSTLKLEPNHTDIKVDALQKLGSVCEDLGHDNEAIKYYKQALELNPYLDIQDNLSFLLYQKNWEQQQQAAIKLEQEGKLQEAAASYRQAIDLRWDRLQFYYEALEANSQNYLLYLQLGNSLVQRGMSDHAIVFYNMGLRINPEHLDLNLQMGKLLAQKNKLHRAKIYLSRVVEIDSQCFEGHLKLGEVQEKIAETASLNFSISDNNNDVIELTEQPIWITLSVNPQASYYIQGESASEQPPTQTKALVQLQFLDSNHNLIPPPYPGVPNSEAVGPYVYISTSGDQLSEFKTQVFSTTYETRYLRLGLRIWYSKKAVILRSKLQLKLNIDDPWLAAIVSYQKALQLRPYDYLLINKLGNLLEKQEKWEQALCCYRQALQVTWNYPHKIQAATASGFNNRVLLPLHLSFPYQQTGYAIRSHSILSSLKQQGVDVLAATRLGYPHHFLSQYKNKQIPEVEEIDGVCYARLNYPLENMDLHKNYDYIANYAQELVKLAISHNASVIHSSSPFENGIASVLAARKIGIKSVYEVRGFWYLSKMARETYFQYDYECNYEQLMESAVVHQADAVVTLSEAMKDKLIYAGVEPQRITIIPNAVDTDEFKPLAANSDLKQKLGLNGDLVVGFIGSLNEYEGVDLLIEAFTGLVNQGINLSLLIVGDGSAKPGLELLVESLNMQPHIIFTGLVPFAEVKNYYALTDVCVFPRKDKQVCQYVPPLKLLEPMAMAKPVIVASLPPLLEVVNHEQTGLVCRVDDVESLQHELLKIYDNPSFGNQMGTNARDWVKTHRQWSSVCQKYLEVYHKLFTLA